MKILSFVRKAEGELTSEGGSGKRVTFGSRVGEFPN